MFRTRASSLGLLQLALSLGLIACAPTPSAGTAATTVPRAPAADAEVNRPAADAEVRQPRVCRTTADVQAAMGQSCAVIGIYELKTFPGKGEGSTLGEWPIVRLADGGEVMVESIWDETKQPDAATLDRYRNKQVEVLGTLHATPPRTMPANFRFFCVSPVESLRLGTG